MSIVKNNQVGTIENKGDDDGANDNPKLDSNMPDKYDMTRTDSPAKYQQRYSITEDPGMANGQVLENGTSSVDKDEKGGKEKKKEEPVNMVGVFETFRFSNCTDRILMIVGTIAALCHGAALPLMVIVLGEMTNSFVSDDSCIDGLTATSSPQGDDACEVNLLDDMKRFALYYIGLGCFVLVLGYGQVAFWQMAAIRQTQKIRAALFKAILRQEIAWFDTQEIGELNTRMSDDVQKIQDGIGAKLGLFFQWFSAFLTGFIIGFIYGWKLTLVILSVSPLLVLSASLMSKLGATMTNKELKAYAKAGAVAEEVLAAIRTVVAFGGEKKECNRYNANLKDAQSFGVKKGMANGLSMGVLYVVMFASYALAFWYGTQLFLKNEYSPGDILIVFIAVLIGAFSLGTAAPNVQNFATARGACYAIYGIIDQIPTIDSWSKQGRRLNKIEGNVEFRNVHFTYPSRPDSKILHGLSFRADVGQTVALVGSSGCGKSTTVQLIQRFYDPAEGTVLLDGVDLRELNVSWLRQHVGVVNQEPVLFATTIKENIMYGRDGVTMSEVEAASKEANAHDFIMQLPKQYDTLVGDRGAQLSGGQKQRVAIARALVRDPKVLLLDEATSALDTESESIVQEALDKARMGRTTIVIAHRLSTVRNADVICGIDKGVVAETGSHAELMKQGGIYNTLVTNQTKEADEPSEETAILKKKDNLSVKRALSVRSDGPTVATGLKKSTPGKLDEEVEEDLPDPKMTRLLSLNKTEWPYILAGCFASVVSGVIQPAFAVIFAEILGVYSIPDLDELEKKANLYSILFLVIGVVAGIAMFSQSFLFAKSGEILTTRLRAKTFHTLLRQNIAYFDDPKNNLGAMTTRLSTDASAVQGATGVRAAMMIMSVSSILTGLVIGFVYSWQLTLLILGFAPFLIGAGYMEVRMISGGSNESKEAFEAAGKVGVECIENIRTVVTLCKEEHFLKEYLGHTRKPYTKALRKSNFQGIAFSFSQSVLFYAYAASFYLGAYLVDKGEINYTEMFRVFGAIVFSAMGVGNASSFAPDYGKAKVAAARLFKLFDTQPPIDSYSDEGEKVSDFRGSVQLTNVMFNYPTRPDIMVLKGVDISVEPGQVVALVGSSGCGKSTIIQLLERFYDPHTGQVMLHGKALPSLNIQWLRSQMGLVQQEPILFDNSIKENIAYGDNTREVQMPEIIEAAKQANIHSFITSLPAGYDTNVGDKGAQLSGGQKQRVAIARALIRNPKILLLDEATSALDTESEKVVQEALDAAQKGRTSIVIAHRLSTIQNADCIVVLKNGVITEMGTHNSLLEQRGFYHKLQTIQARTT